MKALTQSELKLFFLVPVLLILLEIGGHCDLSAYLLAATTAQQYHFLKVDHLFE